MTLEISNANISISLIQTTMEIYLDQNQGLKIRKKQCLLFVVAVVFFLVIQYAFLPHLIC